MLYNIYEPKAEALDMTKFTKENLHKDGPYIFYSPPGQRWNSKEHKFVARFKRVAGANDGYPTTKAGYDAWFKVYMEKIEANHA